MSPKFSKWTLVVTLGVAAAACGGHTSPSSNKGTNPPHTSTTRGPSSARSSTTTAPTQGSGPPESTTTTTKPGSGPPDTMAPVSTVPRTTLPPIKGSTTLPGPPPVSP